MSAQEILLGVNIDHTATLRQARYKDCAETVGGIVEPDPVYLAQLAEQAGADGITVHLREDRRHIQDRDVERMREVVRVPLNLEMAATEAMAKIACRIQPDFACIVPENREEVTTEGGLDVVGNFERIKEITEQLMSNGTQVSLFIDPDEAQIQAASAAGAPLIELHTGAYANAYNTPERVMEYDRLHKGCEVAHLAGLTVNAGHGINYINIAEVRMLPHLHELNIGHSILCRALYSGIQEAVREMRRLMNVGR